jgi:signal transduction histidine kinase
MARPWTPVRLRRRLGVQMRSALAAALVVGVASLLAGAVLLVIARGILLDNVNAAANDRAAQVAAAIARDDGADLVATLRPSPRERTVVQVLDSGGRVVAASDAITGVGAMSSLRPAAGERLHEQQRLAAAHGEPFHIVAVGVDTGTGLQTVLVAESLDVVDDGTEAIIAALLLGMPLLVLVVGAATFVFVGRTLRPVEAMRRQATTITSKNLHTRLPVPGADDEIAALASTMNTMLDRIEAASAAQRRFVADASHELRSPLATIHANIDLLGAVQLPDDAVDPVGRIQHESVRMARLVEDLLLLARVDDHELRLRQEDVDLDDLVYAERDRIAVEHPDLTVEGRVDPVRISGDPHHLQRVLRNLVDNAGRHARRTMTISLAAVDGEAHLVVGNDGPSISAEDQERIFDRFVRLDDSRARLCGGGTGLGLPIARDIVVAHGGTLGADNRHSGAAMRIRIPLPGP